MSLIRIIKRRTSSSLDLDEFFSTEFTDALGNPDLSLSVFEASLSDLVQIQTEQLVGNNLSPAHRGSVQLDTLHGWVKIQATPTLNSFFNFSFSSQAHRELHFSSATKLRQLVSNLKNNLASCGLPETREKTMQDFARQQLAQNHPEWLDVIQLSQKVRQWVQK